MSKDEIKMTYSAVVSKNGRNMVSVRFDRGMDYAEGVVPECKIQKRQGFSNEEIKQLEEYLADNTSDIISKSKEITNIKRWF